MVLRIAVFRVAPCFGKGEVESSILSGSTIKTPIKYRFLSLPDESNFGTPCNMNELMQGLWKHKNGYYYATTSTPTGTKRVSLRVKDPEKAQRILMSSSPVAFEHPGEKLKSVDHFVCRIHRRAKTNGKARGLEIGITKQDIYDLWEKQKGKCAMTGISFDLRKSGSMRRPWAASLDRIDSKKGYTPDNVRLVAMAVNFAMGAWGEGVFWKMIREASLNLRRSSRQNLNAFAAVLR